MPKATKDNYKIYLCRLIDHNHEHYEFTDSVKAFLMMGDVRILRDEELTAGDIPIFDMEGVNLKYLTRIALPIMKKFMEYIQVIQSSILAITIILIT